MKNTAIKKPLAFTPKRAMSKTPLSIGTNAAFLSISRALSRVSALKNTQLTVMRPKVKSPPMILGIRLSFLKHRPFILPVIGLNICPIT